MNEFNIFNNNLIKQISQGTKISSAKAGMVENSQNIIQNSLPLQNSQVLQNYNYEIPLFFPDLNPDKMNNDVVLKYIQNLLNLPESINKFIEELVNNNLQKSQEVTKILIENLINVKELGEFLNKNSDIALQKILQVISTSLKSGMSDVSQLKEIMNILTVIQASTSDYASNNALKEFLLLYIPLNIPVFDKPLDFGAINKEMQENINASTLSIMLQTINFSNLLICILFDNNSCYLDFYCGEFFPKEKFKKILSAFSDELNLNIETNFKINKCGENDNKNQNLKIISQNAIPADMLILSHFIVKTIFNIDNDFNNKINA